MKFGVTFSRMKSVTRGGCHLPLALHYWEYSMAGKEAAVQDKKYKVSKLALHTG